MSLILTIRKKIFLLREFHVAIYADKFSFRILCGCFLSCPEMCFGALIGFFNAVKSNSLLATEDYCLG
jgi:hypothetical protein